MGWGELTPRGSMDDPEAPWAPRTGPFGGCPPHEPRPARQASEQPSRACTGLTATWCPIHGQCRCEGVVGPGDDPACPLHAPDSTHACGPLPMWDPEPTTGAPGAPPPWQARPLPTGYWQRLWAALRGR